MQYFNGDFVEGKPLNPNAYLPESIKNKIQPAELSNKINSEHFKLMGNDKDKSKRLFVSYCQYFPYFGSYHTDIEIVSSKKRKTKNKKF